MSGLTFSSMRDARDAEDNRLLESGEIDLLLAGWTETIAARCVSKMRGPVAERFEGAESRAPEEPDEVDRLFGVDPSD